MATYLQFFHLGTGKYIDELLVDASMTARGVWHDGKIWYFYNGATMFHYTLTDNVFDRELGFAVSSKIPNYQNGGQGGMCGDRTNLYVAHHTSIQIGPVAQIMNAVSIFTKRDIKFQDELFSETYGIGDSRYYDITHKGTSIVTMRERTSGGFIFSRRGVINISTGKREITNDSARGVRYRSFTYDDDKYWTGLANGRIDYVKRPLIPVGPQSATGASTSRASCLVMDAGGNYKSTGILAVIRT